MDGHAGDVGTWEVSLLKLDAQGDSDSLKGIDGAGGGG